jgi:hypothetical protein
VFQAWVTLGEQKWVNSREPRGSNPPDAILLVGDSIVVGGNPLRMKDRLGAQLEHAVGRKVWPIAAGSWALLNELAYILHPDVAAHVGQIVIVSNSADFDKASSWSCDVSHPRHKPAMALLYLFEKYVNDLGACTGAVPPGLKFEQRDLAADLTAFAGHYRDKTVVFLYPDVAEITDRGVGTLTMDKLRAFYAVNGIMRLYSILDTAAWTATNYRDSIHPNVVGNRVLAEIMAEALQR